MGLSRSVSEIDGDFRNRKKFPPTPLYFVPPLKALQLGIGARGQKAKMMGYRAEKEV